MGGREMQSPAVLLILLLAVSQWQIIHIVYAAEFAQLDSNGKYNVSWVYNDTDITFTLYVETTGWIGLGFSPDGGMQDSDIVTIEPTQNGNAIITDRYTYDSKSRPQEDFQQDWTLLSREVSGNVTTVQASRKLKICRTHGQGQDFSIGTDTMRLIWAFGYVPNLSYHRGDKRGSKSLYLLVMGKEDLPERPSNAQDYDYVVTDLPIPAKPTTYWCTLFPMPPLLMKHHVISFEPVIERGNERYVHHILVNACHNGINGSDYINSNDHSHECYSPNMPGDILQCQSTVFAWAVGGGKFTYPAEAGLAIGDSGAPDYVVLQTHYDNPDETAGVIDNSGIRITYTETLRPYDVDIISVGSLTGILVPPRRPSTEVAFMCDSMCLEEAIPTGGIHAFAGLLHSHLLGRKLTLRHTRPDGHSDFLLSDHSYDFNFQETRYFPEPVVINKGDSLQVTCSMGSKHLSHATYGGLSTTEEMCVGYLQYYPRIDLSHCSSSPILEAGEPATDFYATIGVNASTVKSAGHSIWLATKDVEWTQEKGQIIEDSYFDYDHLGLCYAKLLTTFYNANFKIISKDKFSRNDTVVPPCDVNSSVTDDEAHPDIVTGPGDDPTGDGSRFSAVSALSVFTACCIYSNLV